MALQKTIALPSNVSGNYLRIVAFQWDRASRTASAHFYLYKDAATAALVGSQPIWQPIAAKLRLSGDDFDAYLGPAALAGAEDVLGQLYTAAKAISLERHTTGETRIEAHIASDFGHDLFWDAEDV